MSKDTIKKYKDDYFLFLESGFVAVNSQDEDSAIKLFTAAQAIKPKDPFPKIGYGYMHMCKLELKLAEEMFLSALKNDSNNELAQSFLGICKSMMPGKTSEGEKVLEKLNISTKDPEMKELITRSREFIDQHVKKNTVSPMDLSKSKKNKPKKK